MRSAHSTQSLQTGSPDSDQPRVIDRRRVMTKLGLLAVAAAAARPGPAASATSLSPSQTCSGAGTVWWSELVCPDPEQVREFYAMVVGWQHDIVALEDPSRPPYIGEPEYTVFKVGTRESAGLVKTDAGEPIHARSGWLTYIEVANVDVSAQIAASKGGKVIKAPFDMPGVGRIAVIEDPQGTMVGLVTPLQSQSC